MAKSPSGGNGITIAAIDWDLLDQPRHRGIQTLVRDLNALYRREAALHQRDSVSTGFRWVIGDDSANSVFAFLRYGNEDGRMVLVVCNMTPVPRVGYGIGVPRPGYWRELLNTDAGVYGGSNMGNAGGVETVAIAMHGEAQALFLTLPPLATIFLSPEHLNTAASFDRRCSRRPGAGFWRLRANLSGAVERIMADDRCRCLKGTEPNVDFGLCKCDIDDWRRNAI